MYSLDNLSQKVHNLNNYFPLFLSAAKHDRVYLGAVQTSSRTSDAICTSFSTSIGVYVHLEKAVLSTVHGLFRGIPCNYAECGTVRHSNGFVAESELALCTREFRIGMPNAQENRYLLEHCSTLSVQCRKCPSVKIQYFAINDIPINSRAKLNSYK